MRGMRITVMNVVDTLNREDLNDYLSSFPDVTLEHIRQAVQYCMTLTCKSDSPERFCDGCTLRTEQEGISFEEYLASFNDVSTHDRPAELTPGTLAFTGSMEEFRREWEGSDGWKLAEDLYIYLKRIDVMD